MMKEGQSPRWQVVKLVLLAGVVTLVAGLGGSGAAAAARPSASLAEGPAVFSRLSCLGSSFCIATGTYPKPGHPHLTVLEEWNGHRWRIIPKPRWYSSLTCGGPSFCLAATSPPKAPARTLVWNGRTWHVLKNQPPDVYNVVCESPTFCVTSANPYYPVGYVAWNGKGWAKMTEDSGGCGTPQCEYYGIICYTATNCVTSGFYCTDDNCDSTVDFSQTWNGTAWNQSPGTPDPFPGARACAGRSFCMLFEYAFAMAAITQDWGNSWHDASANLVAVCRGAADCHHFAGLSCGSPRFCVALPSGFPSAALTWKGTTWAAAHLVRIHGHIPHLTLLSCGSARNCIAIGSYRPVPRGTPRLIAEHWNGTAWQVTPMPIP